MKFLVSVTVHLGFKKLLITCWFYVKNCIFVHMTDEIFRDPWSPHCPPEVEVLEPPLTAGT